MRSKSLDFRNQQPRLYNQEMIMKMQADRQKSPLKTQQELQADFIQSERHILNKLIIVDHFAPQFSKYDN